MEFIKGKWYSSPEWKDFYIRVDSFCGNIIKVKEIITRNVYKEQPESRQELSSS